MWTEWTAAHLPAQGKTFFPQRRESKRCPPLLSPPPASSPRSPLRPSSPLSPGQQCRHPGPSASASWPAPTAALPAEVGAQPWAHWERLGPSVPPPPAPPPSPVQPRLLLCARPRLEGVACSTDGVSYQPTAGFLGQGPECPCVSGAGMRAVSLSLPPGAPTCQHELDQGTQTRGAQRNSFPRTLGNK